MKKRKNATRNTLCIVMVFLVFAAMPSSVGDTWSDTTFALQPDRTSYVKLWTNKECGSHYTEGEPIVIFFQVISPATNATIILRDYTAEDTKYLIHTALYSTNTVHRLIKPAECPAGLETLEIQAAIPLYYLPPDMASAYHENIRLSDTCYFYVDPPCSQDKDGDEFFPPQDCDDDNPLVHPGVEETCDGKDNDCDTTVDEGCFSCIADWDGDSFPECNDCNDNDRTVYPGSAEVCDEKDNDCDGLIDEGCCTCYNDNDRDGYSDCWDSNDNDPTVYPGSFIVHGKQSGCPGYIDKESNCHYAEIWVNKKCNAYYSDREAIEIYFRVTSSAFTAKVTVKDYPPEGDPFVLLENRTLSTNTVNSIKETVQCPGGSHALMITAVLTIDGKPVTLTGDCTIRVINCRAPDNDGDGHTAMMRGGDDCDDTDSTVFPGAVELCDGKDNDCNGQRDEGFTDNDQDGYADCGGDCNDTDPTIHPKGEELCDGKDNDCDGIIDEGFTDKDQDGFADCGGDCDDTDPTVYPGASEVQDGKDNNCDGIIDNVVTMDQIDGDQDGHPLSVDCNDKDSTIHPGAPELCTDGKDNDCDGIIDCEDIDCRDDSACKTGLSRLLDLTSILGMIETYKYYVAGGIAGIIAVILVVYLFRRRRKEKEEEEIPPITEEEVSFGGVTEEKTTEKMKEDLFDRLEGKEEPTEEKEETFSLEEEFTGFD